MAKISPERPSSLFPVSSGSSLEAQRDSTYILPHFLFLFSQKGFILTEDLVISQNGTVRQEMAVCSRSPNGGVKHRVRLITEKGVGRGSAEIIILKTLFVNTRQIARMDRTQPFPHPEASAGHLFTSWREATMTSDITQDQIESWPFSSPHPTHHQPVRALTPDEMITIAQRFNKSVPDPEASLKDKKNAAKLFDVTITADHSQSPYFY